jgi:FixJ family two-component response regulator
MTSNPANTSRERFVFLIDDDDGSRASIEALLEPMGVKIGSFANAEEFLANYKGERPGCLITDQRMPGMSGIQLLEALKQRGVTMSVIVMTAFPDTRSTVRAILGGAMTLIEKPCNPQELWDAIQDGIRKDQERHRRELELADAKARLQKLTTGEWDVLRLLAEGRANKVIANQLNVSLRTVEGRRASIFEKLHVQSVAEMMIVWLGSKQSE